MGARIVSIYGAPTGRVKIPAVHAELPLTARIPNDVKMWQPRLGIAWNYTTPDIFILQARGVDIFRLSLSPRNSLIFASWPKMMIYSLFKPLDKVSSP